MADIYNDFVSLIGRTPILRAHRLEEEYSLSAKLLLKLEYLNPAGSVKDRVGAALIEDAEEKGLIKEGAVIIEPTSGNTGIGLAAVAAVKGYKVILTMPDTMSVERRKLLGAYGAQIVLTEGAKGMQGAVEKAQELAAQIPGSYIPGQFVNPANADAHYKTTGPEIWDDTDGEVDIFVAGIGTGGTITGTGRYLKDKNAQIKVAGVEPADSPLLTKGVAGAHGLQGIGANFIPDVLDRSILDEVMPVTTQEAYEAARILASKEGILVGISSGAALHAGIELAKRGENAGKSIVVLLPDTGDRYLSTDLF